MNPPFLLQSVVLFSTWKDRVATVKKKHQQQTHTNKQSHPKSHDIIQQAACLYISTEKGALTPAKLQLLFANLFQQELGKTKPDACNPPSPGGVSFFHLAIPYFLYLEPVLILPAWGPTGLSFAMTLTV